MKSLGLALSQIWTAETTERGWGMEISETSRSKLLADFYQKATFFNNLGRMVSLYISNKRNFLLLPTKPVLLRKLKNS